MGAYIGDTSNDGAFELSLVQFIHGGLQIVGGLKFHKPWLNVNELEGSIVDKLVHPPSTLFTASLRVNHVQSRLAGEVFQILFDAW